MEPRNAGLASNADACVIPPFPISIMPAMVCPCRPLSTCRPPSPAAAVVRERVYDIRRAVAVVEGEPMEMEG